MPSYLVLGILLAIFFCMWFGKNPTTPVKKENFTSSCSSCDDIQTPSVLKENNIPESDSYAYGVVEKQAHEIRRLRRRLKQIALKVDDNSSNKFYRTKLSNKYYRPKPILNKLPDVAALNLHDDDFSNKTLSTIKFLSQTRPSKYFGNEIHFPTELCGNYCTTNDKNVQMHEQIDLVRPIAPTDYIQTNK